MRGSSRGRGDGLKFSGGTGQIVRLVVGRLMLIPGKAGDPQTSFDGGQVAQIPAFQFMAGHAHQAGRVMGFSAFLHETVLHLLAVLGILVAQHDKAGIRHPVAAHSLYHLLFEILFALENDVTTTNRVRK